MSWNPVSPEVENDNTLADPIWQFCSFWPKRVKSVFTVIFSINTYHKAIIISKNVEYDYLSSRGVETRQLFRCLCHEGGSVRSQVALQYCNQHIISILNIRAYLGVPQLRNFTKYSFMPVLCTITSGSTEFMSNRGRWGLNGSIFKFKVGWWWFSGVILCIETEP